MQKVSPKITHSRKVPISFYAAEYQNPVFRFKNP
jgi:hypothetical protein